MQKRTYQQFRDQHQTELPAYPSIPIGQPIPLNQYPQQFIPQPNNAIHHHQYIQPPQINIQPQPQAFHIPPPPIAQNPQQFNFPVQVQCPCCKMNVPTVVNQESGNTTYLWCGFIGCCITPVCCCVPFLMDSCLDKTHYCPNCGHTILRKHQRCFEFIGC